jgi:hypothetical protein
MSDAVIKGETLWNPNHSQVTYEEQIDPAIPLGSWSKTMNHTAAGS